MNLQVKHPKPNTLHQKPMTACPTAPPQPHSALKPQINQTPCLTLSLSVGVSGSAGRSPARSIHVPTLEAIAGFCVLALVYVNTFPGLGGIARSPAPRPQPLTLNPEPQRTPCRSPSRNPVQNLLRNSSKNPSKEPF